jgi:ATP-dependent Clp protease protease subunit
MLEIIKPQSQIKDRVYERYLDDRMIILNEDVNDDLIEKVVMPIIRWNKKDDERQKKETKFKRDDPENIIHIYINTYGGTAYECNSALSVIENSKTPIYTYSLGKSLSAGLWLFVAGHRRFIQKYGTLMYHEIQGGTWGSMSEMQCDLNESKRLMTQLDNFLISHTKITQEMLDAVKKSNPHNWYIDAETALKYEIAHEIF